MEHGKLITIEGTEGAGKSTALKFIHEYLEKLNKKMIVTREPGGTPIAENIRQLLLYPTKEHTHEKMCWETELLLMFAARAQHIHALILPALEAGKWVLSDRYVDASYAYQGGGREISMEHIAMLDHWVVRQARPNLTILLDIDPEIGLKRALDRGLGKDRIEQEKIDFFERVRDVYLQRANEMPERIKIVNAAEPIDTVKQQIRIILNNFLEENV